MVAYDGIQQIVFGVEDMPTCTRFLNDWGLKQVSDTQFETLDGSAVVITADDTPDLPPAIEPGPTLRQVTWRLRSQGDLDNLERRLQNIASFRRKGDQITCTDPNGVGLVFVVGTTKAISAEGSPLNDASRNARVDARSPVYEHGEPVKIGHVVFFTADVLADVKFYTEVLGFHVSDSYPGSGYFLRCREEGGHHDLFLLQTPAKNRGLNHVAFTVRDIHEVFGGGIHMNAKGWQTQIGPGRHPISSAYFWYVDNPCGGLAEYYTNEDYCTRDWQAQEWARSNEHFAEWAITGGIDPQTRRQIKS